ncbi:hypothetical protein [Pelagivirga sediminicola]|uniref:hypothetical protein n=1 Tax=Pelagivirga sediminicola TaxID=2170575 RepID=UPI00140319EA|nr:hypothetical protein [Pelagivirga sediminicola]
MTWNDALATAALATLFALPAALDAQQTARPAVPDPLSAIDWLEQAAPAPRADEPPVAGQVTIPSVEVTPLDAATAGAVGLLPPSVTGLPADLWRSSDAADLTALWRRVSTQPPPAIQALYHTLLLAEADPPQGDSGAYLRTRVAILRRFGAVEPALELMTRAGPERAALFGEWFDLSLLIGNEVEACTALRDAPTLLNDDAAQIYCTALTGDWRTALLLYDTRLALGSLGAERAALLDHFLDPEMSDGAAPPAPMTQPTALDFRLFEAIGTPLATRDLPAAFAMADLRGTVGWKAEIEAAERLTRLGALGANRLMGLYTRQSPSASGGVWDRAQAVQDLDAALEDGAPGAIGAALTAAWDLMREVGLELPFAEMFAARLDEAELTGDAQVLAFRIALLTSEYEAVAASPPPGPAARALAALAQGRADAALADGAAEQVIAGAFAAPPQAPPEHAELIRRGKLGEAILSAALQFDRADGDPRQMADALGTLRAVGLEDTARRAALQALILEQAQ